MPNPLQLSILVLTIALIAGCAGSGSRVGDADLERLMAHYQSWQGTPHRFGGASRAGIDCSAFTREMYRAVWNRSLPRHTRDQARLGERVKRQRLRHGDLVFFKTGWRKYHVGIYVGGGHFIHAAESAGVSQTSLDNPYWSKRYWKARRII